MKEIEIKLKLIKWLMEGSNSSLIIGSEFRFDFGARRADVISLSDKLEACAYEIKSIGDSLRSLNQQCKGYKLYFDKCFVVCEKQNINMVRKNLPSHVGLLLIDGDSFKQIRKARENKTLSGAMLCSTIDTNFLRRELGERKASKVELCNMYSKKISQERLRLVSRGFLKSKIEYQFKLFLSELGQEINYDDLATLDRMPASQLV